MSAIPFFDGHNDTLLRLLDQGDDAATAFVEGNAKTDIDLPRAREGGMVGGFFAMFPPPLKSSGTLTATERNEGKLPAELEFEPAMRSINSMARLLYKIEQSGVLRVCRNAGSLREAIAAGEMAALFHIEGAEPIDLKLDSLHVLHAAGLRSLGLTWSRANAFGTGVPFKFPADPDIGPGLTDAGKALVRECNALGVLIDLSHLNAAGFRDVAATSQKPLVATHSNVHALCAHPRNLLDWQLAAIRETKGVVGLNYAVGFLREDGQFRADTELEVLVRHVDALLEALGEDGVALGSDFDGAMMPRPIKDVAGVPNLLQAMLDKGYGEPLVRKIALDNWLSVVERTIG
ncbi:dipeptidase [Devosia pacifica]|uniref:dipeptidase n=1 Tax=Devosia pacifica TaxID=1335967 RepID=UPI001FCEF74A|nr:dipeptidase [Devosia pacifica]